MRKLLSPLLAALVAVAASSAHADVRITEWMYSGNGGEFIEFTNLGLAAVDFTGWSYDDDSATPGVFDLTGFGVVAAGESVVITEDDASAFMSDWNLSGVKVLGGYTNNIGRADTINLFNGMTLVDSLAYGDQTIGGPRTQNASGIAGSAAALGANNAPLWQLSVVGDFEDSYLSLNNDIGSPGFTSYTAPVPEAETYALMLAGLGLVGWAARRRKQ